MVEEEILKQIGEVQDLLQHRYAVCPAILPRLQQHVDSAAIILGLPYRLRATLKRGRSGRFDLLHIVRIK